MELSKLGIRYSVHAKEKAEHARHRPRRLQHRGADPWEVQTLKPEVAKELAEDARGPAHADGLVAFSPT